MNFPKNIFFLLLIIPQFGFCQLDTTKYDWERVIFEVFSTKLDSLNSKQYVEYKEPFFIAYFNSFSPQDIDSIKHHCQELGNHPDLDSINNPQYIKKFNFCWVLMNMRLGIGIKQAIKELNESYDAFGDSVRLVFIVNGKQVSLHDNFKVFYVLDEENKQRIVEAKVSKDIFIAPDIEKDAVGSVIFEYNNKFYIIGKGKLEYLRREVQLTLIFETKPYRPIILNDKQLSSLVQGTRDELNKKQNMNGVFYIILTRFHRDSHDYFRRKSDFYRKGKIIIRNAKMNQVINSK